MTSYRILKTSLLGDLLLVADPTHLLGLYFRDCTHCPAIENDWRLDAKHPILSQTAEQLREFFAGDRTDFSIPLHYAGTPFQREIWRQITEIPFGQTITYSDLAARAGIPRAIRAAGTATGRNRLGIIIPCHRVVGMRGSLGGYAGGLERKKRLLEIETSGAELFTAADTGR